jgi:pimeloyl-ACP methyl ester carboxylesterase
MFLFHGAPASRLFAPNPVTTAEAGIRLITVDRPGYGRSDPRPGRQILDWPDDVVQLADTLGVQEFDVSGHSSGGPYVLACVYKVPERIRRVALISCVAPFGDSPAEPLTDDDALTVLARQDPARAAAEFAQSVAFLVETPERFLDLPRPEPDVKVLADPDIRSMLSSTIRDALKQGTDAYGWDCALERRPWGFELSDIETNVSIWQGGQDKALPPADATVLAAGLPRSRSHFVAGEGHGLILARWQEILGDLAIG